MKMIKGFIKKIIRNFLEEVFPGLKIILSKDIDFDFITSNLMECNISENVKFYKPYKLHNVHIGRYTYIARNSVISHTTIGSFCSIGPNFVCGWGIHPSNGISTSPMFYSVLKQNGFALSEFNKIEERKQIKIGNDVFIGANVTILDGVTIGNGVIIGAGAVVSKNIPDYAIAIGVPIKILRYRFDKDKIKVFQKIEWWNFDDIKLQEIEKTFFDVNSFLAKYSNTT